MGDSDSVRTGPGPGRPDPFSVLTSWAGMWADGLGAWQAPRNGLAPAFGARESADLSPALAQAAAASAASVLRGWQAMAELQWRYQARLMQAAARLPGAECRALADEVRAYLREVGDAAAQESRRLQRDLDAIGEGVAQAVDRAAPLPDQPRRRRHEVKA